MTDASPPSSTVPVPIARYRFTVTVSDDLLLPEYAGSLLRGIFGAALRRLCCMTGMPQCPPCPLYQTCPYPAIFEAPPRATSLPQHFNQVANPYVIEPPAPGRRRLQRGETLAFHMVLVGADTLRNLPLIIHAWQRALAHGLGPRRIPAALQTVHWSGERESVSVWSAGQARVAEHDAGLYVPAYPPAETGEVCLDIETPMRLQHNGKPLPAAALSPRALLLAAARRITLLQDLYLGSKIEGLPPVGQLLQAIPAITDDRSQLQWRDWTRYSSRQKQEMTLGGVVGRWRLSGNVAVMWPWLWLCQWLHIGKNATMGMGGYRLISL